MRCYRHPDREAIGVCSSCFKAVCPECAKERSGKIICVECEQKLENSIKEKIIDTHKMHREQKRSIMEVIKTLYLDKLFEGRPDLPKMELKYSDIVVPVFLGGFIAGILAGIPIFNFLFFLSIPLGAAITIGFLRIERDYDYIVGIPEGRIMGFLSGLVAAVVSILMLISLQAIFAPEIHDIASGILSESDMQKVGLLFGAAGLDPGLSLTILTYRFIFGIIVYPAIGLLAGMHFAKRMR